MKFKILKDKRFSLDGVNVLTFTKDEIVENLSGNLLNALGDCCEQVKPVVKRKRAVKKAPKNDIDTEDF